MKKGKGLLYAALAALFVCVGAMAVVAADAPDTITIKPGIWKEPTKTPVKFEHKKHAEDYKVACTECHHVFQDGKNVWKQGDPVKKCEECHTEATIQGEKKLPPDQKKLNLKLAFHDNCISCHKKLKKDKPDTTAPVVCAGCHPGAKEE